MSERRAGKGAKRRARIFFGYVAGTLRFARPTRSYLPGAAFWIAAMSRFVFAV